MQTLVPQGVPRNHKIAYPHNYTVTQPQPQPSHTNTAPTCTNLSRRDRHKVPQPHDHTITPSHPPTQSWRKHSTHMQMSIPQGAPRCMT
eukprot:213304-Chlamydomonas_euryale.AAC.1